LLAMLLMGPTSCATSGVRPDDSEEDLLGEAVEQAGKQSSSKEGGLKGKVDQEEEDLDLEDESQDGLDEVEKCLNIVIGDEERAWDPNYMDGHGKKKRMSKKKVSKRCLSI